MSLAPSVPSLPALVVLRPFLVELSNLFEVGESISVFWDCVGLEVGPSPTAWLQHR